MKEYSKLESKAKQHRIVFSDTIRCYLCNPSDDCADIKYGIENGFILPTTRLLCVERNKKSAQTIKSYLNSLPNESSLYQCEYHNTPVDFDIDNVFVDLFGGLTIPLIDWLNKSLSKKIIVNGFFSLTISTRLRHNTLLPATIGILQNFDSHLAQRCEIFSKFRSNRDRKIAVSLCFLLEQFAFSNRNVDLVNYDMTKETKFSDEMLILKLKIGKKQKNHIPHPLCEKVSNNTGLIIPNSVFKNME